MIQNEDSTTGNVSFTYTLRWECFFIYVFPKQKSVEWRFLFSLERWLWKENVEFSNWSFFFFLKLSMTPILRVCRIVGGLYVVYVQKHRGWVAHKQKIWIALRVIRFHNFSNSLTHLFFDSKKNSVFRQNLWLSDDWSLLSLELLVVRCYLPFFCNFMKK